MPSYRNPVLRADWSDPDVVRVGEDYYLTASTFTRVPGLPILLSRDLVNWRIIGHALDALVPEGHFDLPRHGCGVWAPAIRHHAGRFYIFYPDPDHGIYVTEAEDPAGPWSEPHLLYAGRGLIDPCPLWDDDGRAYLAHAWAATRSGFNNVITLHEMSADARRILGPGRVVIDGNRLPGFSVLEGPKLYKRDGWYWIFAPAGSVPTGWQSVFRARDPWGPYEERTVLAQGSTAVNGPHQGAWVDAPDGSHWFVHFQDAGAFGRVVHLQPMSWGDDGWPRFGTLAGTQDTGAGEPVTEHAAPVGSADAGSGDPVAAIELSGDRLGRAWYWQANPRDDWARLEAGVLRLRAVADDPVNLREIPHLLAQRLPLGASSTSVRLDAGDLADGARAGLAIVGERYCWIGVRSTAEGLVVECATGGADRTEASLATPVPVSGPVRLRAEVDAGGAVRLSWSDARGAEVAVDATFAAAPGKWSGAELGLFATAPLGAPESWARFDDYALTVSP